MITFMEFTCDISGPTSAVKPNHWRRPATLSASDISRESTGAQSISRVWGTLAFVPTYFKGVLFKEGSETPCREKK
jgi:hypothetical protein